MSYLSQSDYIYDSTGAEIDFIGRFENLEKDFSFVCKKIFNKEILLPHKFKTKEIGMKLETTWNYTLYVPSGFLDSIVHA